MSVMVLDCARLPWKVDDIVAGLDDGLYTYAQLMFDLCVLDPTEIDLTLPPEWNHLERYEPERTKLVHFTVVPTQPWKNDDNPLSELWVSWFRQAVDAGAVTVEEVEAAVRAGHVKRSLLDDARRARREPEPISALALELDAARRRMAELTYELSTWKPAAWPRHLWNATRIRIARLRRP
jgi:hypothetical protein